MNPRALKVGINRDITQQLCALNPAVEDGFAVPRSPTLAYRSCSQMNHHVHTFHGLEGQMSLGHIPRERRGARQRLGASSEGSDVLAEGHKMDLSTRDQRVQLRL